jgi:hypothetical protein
MQTRLVVLGAIALFLLALVILWRRGLREAVQGIALRQRSRMLQDRAPPQTIAPPKADPARLQQAIEEAAQRPKTVEVSHAPRPVAPPKPPAEPEAPLAIERAPPVDARQRVTEMAQEQWDSVEVVGGKGSAAMPELIETLRPAKPSAAPPPKSRDEELGEATQKLARAIDRSWDGVQVVTPKGKAPPKDDE